MTPLTDEHSKNATIFTNHFTVRDAYPNTEESDTDKTARPLILRVETETKYSLDPQMKTLESYGDLSMTKELIDQYVN
ncbi:MAG: hypothetical protein GQ477_04850 [Nanohaloarchaea archaeon]|nr:hypothetical protein [Candidatus Nanohaloarchaea archaeon]